ncbi:hypothetical protein Lal_00009377 [Lupinus albus]|nr:hypothetical protein Lal_00009377 [Lupinus albus]
MRWPASLRSSSCASSARWSSTSPSQVRSATSPTSIRPLHGLPVRLELLGAVHPRQHGRTVGRRDLRAVLVAGRADLGVGARVLRRHQPDQPDQREVVRRDGILVLDHQGRGDRRDDRLRRLAARERQRRAGGQRPEPVAARRLLPERRVGPRDVDGRDHVLVRRARARRHHGGRGRRSEAQHPARDQPGHLPHPDFLHRRARRAAVAVSVGEGRQRRQPVRADLPRAEQQPGRERAERRRADGRAVGLQQRRVLQQPDAVRPRAAGQCAEGAVLGEQARHSARRARRVGARHRRVRAGQLLHAGQGVRGADGPRRVGADHQLGDDQPDPPEVPPGQARSRGEDFLPQSGYPFTNYLCLAFMAGILVVMYLTPDLRLSVYLIPVWLAVLAIGYRFRQKNAGYAVRDSASAG